MANRDAKVVTFNPVKDRELLEFLEDKKFSTYCKKLIREDMERQREINDKVLTDRVITETYLRYEKLLDKLESTLDNVNIDKPKETKPTKINKDKAKGVLGIFK